MKKVYESVFQLCDVLFRENRDETKDDVCELIWRLNYCDNKTHTETLLSNDEAQKLNARFDLDLTMTDVGIENPKDS